MRYRELRNQRRQASPELTAWLKTWVASTVNIEAQAEAFQTVANEASQFLNKSYPALFRGLSLSEDDLERLCCDESIKIPAHALQSWTKSQAIALDYAIPGEGGDCAVLIRKNGKQLLPCLDVVNILLGLPKDTFTTHEWSVVRTDAQREKEVIVETDGWLTIHPREMIKARW